jgi:hypothetical protein
VPAPLEPEQVALAPARPVADDRENAERFGRVLEYAPEVLLLEETLPSDTGGRLRSRSGGRDAGGQIDTQP